MIILRIRSSGALTEPSDGHQPLVQEAEYCRWQVYMTAER